MNGPLPFALGAADQARLEEAERLAALGAAGVDPLLRRLDDPNWVVRRAVVAGLAALGDLAVGPLCDVLSTRRDDEARIAAAVDALVASTGSVHPSVAALLAEDGDPAVIADGAQVVGRRRSVASVPALARLVGHDNDNVVVAAIEALGRIGGTAALGPVVAAAESGNFFRTFPAIDVLGRSGDALAVGPLARLVDNPLYSHEAARALGRTGQLSAAAPLLAVLAREGDALLRVVAAALVDLVARHGERTGTTEPVERVIREVPQPDAINRRLARAVAGADASEQVALCRVLGWVGGDVAVGCLLDLIDGGSAAIPAATALSSLGVGAADRVRAALREGDSARRLLLLPMVLDVPSAAPEVLRCLEDPEAAVRSLACAALSRVGGPDALAALFACLDDPEARVFQAAVSAVEVIGGPEALSRALAAVRSPDSGARLGALLILAHGGFPEALDDLIEASADPDERVREAAIHGLARFDDPAARATLLAAAAHPSDRARAAAMRALGQGVPDARTLPALLGGLADRSAWVRYYACQALGRLGDLADAGAADAVIALLGDPAGQVRIAAVEALGHLPSDAARRVLRDAAASLEPEIQRAALRAIGVARVADGLPMVLRAVSASDALTRLVAVSSLTAFDDPGALDALRLAADDRDDRVRGAALDALGARPGSAASAALIELLSRPLARERAARALERPVEGRVPALLAALGASDEESAEALVAALARLHDAGAEGVVDGVLALASPIARRAFAAALALRETPQARAAVGALVSRDPDPEVRRIASERSS